MLKKESKIRILENFLSLDYLFFGKTIHEIDVSTEVAQQYLELKGALCSALIEMYNFMEHNPPEIAEILTESDIEKMAIKTAITARGNVRKLLTCQEGKTNVVNTVFEAVKLNESENIDTIVNFTIQEKAFQLGLDNMLIARALNESEKIDEMNTFEGRLLEDTYKALRNSLIETALEILENKNVTTESEKTDNEKQSCEC